MKLLNDTIINNINDLVLQNPDLHIDIQDISLVLNSKLESENLYKFEGSILELKSQLRILKHF